MKIYRKTPGITASLRRATDEDLLAMELRYPDDRLLPTMGAQESWVLTVGERRNAEAIGFIEYFVRDSELVILGLWVAPDYRNNGYGTMMIELAEATERPDIIRAIVTPQSSGFYEKRGFATDLGHNVVARVSDSLR
jgi:ribosomal protein S18 acetylase RimI-like enzyme